MTELIEASYLISKIHEKETSMRPSKTVAKEQMDKGAGRKMCLSHWRGKWKSYPWEKILEHLGEVSEK